MTNIVRFNWHFYAIALLVGTFVGLTAPHLPEPLKWFCFAGLTAGIGMTFVSLAISHYIYDRSPLYNLDWIDQLEIAEGASVVTVSAGFDETSEILRERLPNPKLRIWDFYDKDQHTEVSIRRARATFPPPPDTIPVMTKQLPLGSGEADLIVLFMSAHEIRGSVERLEFFLELHRILKRGGRCVVTEHLRDLPNFFAYSLGLFHFHRRTVWLDVFSAAGFTLVEEEKESPFISTFVLKKT